LKIRWHAWQQHLDLKASRTMSQNFLGQSDDDFDFDRAASAFPDIDGLDGDVLAPVVPQDQSRLDNHFDMDTTAQFNKNMKITEHDELDKFTSDFPELEPQATILSPPPVNQIQSSTPTFAPRPTQSAALSNAPVLQHAADEEEPEVIKQWRAKRQEEIRKRDEASEARREETIAKAERAIDKFYEDYNATKEKNIKANKESERNFLTLLQDSLSEGTTWSRIAALVELENSQSKTIARSGAGTSDLSRYKEILLRLKREGENAPGAAGY